MYDRLRDLLIGESGQSNAPRPGETRAQFLKRVGARAHAEVQNPKRQKGSAANIVRAIRTGRG